MSRSHGPLHPAGLALFAAHAVLNKFSDAARACTGVIAEIRRGTAPSVMATITKVGEIAREANRYAINFLYTQ
jgi:hypothetical protein